MFVIITVPENESTWYLVRRGREEEGHKFRVSCEHMDEEFQSNEGIWNFISTNDFA